MYTEYNIPAKYKKYITKVWCSSSDASGDEEKIIPDGFSDIIFSNRDDGLSLRYSSFMTQSYEVSSRNGEVLLGIRLNPTYAYSLIHEEMKDLTNHVVPVRDVFKLDLESVRDDFLEHQKFNPKVLDQLIVPREDNFVVEFSVRMILRRKGLVDISELLEKLNISRRYLEKEFKKVIGISPQKYIRIIKLHNYIYNYHDLDDSYYDQSHLCKEFKMFIGETPGAFLDCSHPYNTRFA